MVLAMLFLFALIVACISTKVKKVTVTTSLKNFTVTAPNFFRVITLVCAWLFITLALALYAIFFAHMGLPSGGAIVLMLICPGLCLLLWLALTLWRLDVKGNHLRYRDYFGRRKEISFNQIEKVVTMRRNSLIIFVGGERFGYLNRSFLHLENFHKYCERRGIPI